MKTRHLLLFLSASALAAEPSNGLAPEVTGLNAAAVSYALEAKLPDLEKPFLSTKPQDLKDGLTVGELQGAQKEAVLKFAHEIADGKHGDIDSLLVAHHGQLLFESYYRRGRQNYPHYQMSITKSYTAMAVGRAIQLGHLKMSDLDRPVWTFLNELQPAKFVDGAKDVTLAQAMNMKSGVRIDDAKIGALVKNPAALKGQGQIQAYFQHSAPIPAAPRTFKYQSSDPCMAMQVVQASVPGSAEEFIRKELFGKLGITNYNWETDTVSGQPKSAAGAGVLSRDMVKWGLLVLDKGKWHGEQLIPAEYVAKATSRLNENSATNGYGFFWWTDDFKIGDKSFHAVEGRGAGGQFIFMFPEADLVVVVTAHHKGMGTMLKELPPALLPAFLGR
jgi:CubicO group peptidase (beta-lactamase class C family)